MDIEERLLAAGGNVIGPAANPETARRLIAETAPDAALLDANLAGSRVDDLAAELRRRRIPFAFATGFGRESLPRDVRWTCRCWPSPSGRSSWSRWCGRSSPGGRRRIGRGRSSCPPPSRRPSTGGKAPRGTQSVASGRGRQLKNRAERPMKEHRANERQEMRRLYHQPLSPFCRKIRLVLAEKKIEVELVEERTVGAADGFPADEPRGAGAGAEDRRPGAGGFDRDLRVPRGDPSRAAAAAEEPGAPGRGAAADGLVRRQVPQRGDGEPGLRAGEQEARQDRLSRRARRSRPGRATSSTTSTISAG